MSAFEKYSPFIRDYIYSRNWDSLREVQIGAAEVLFGTENNLLLTSSTASGKTEAAFFPIISRLYDDPPQTFGALYIAPLKSLINDQFSRLDELLDMSGIPVFHWHGDVAMSHKNKALRDPKGILQITPESLESMLMNRNNDIVRLFGDLRYVVLDEIHTLTGTDRGNQIICQLCRISRLIGRDPVRVGLSATIGDTDIAAKWLGAGSERGVSVVGMKETRTSWRLGMEHFYIQSDSPDQSESGNKYLTAVGEATPGKNEPARPEASDNSVGYTPLDPGFEYIYDCTADKKCLVFSNSREETEYLTATLRQIADPCRLRGADGEKACRKGSLPPALCRGHKGGVPHAASVDDKERFHRNDRGKGTDSRTEGRAADKQLQILCRFQGQRGLHRPRRLRRDRNHHDPASGRRQVCPCRKGLGGRGA